MGDGSDGLSVTAEVDERREEDDEMDDDAEEEEEDEVVRFEGKPRFRL